MATKFVTVSIEIMHDKNLSPNQKFILAEIHQLSSLDKGCIATNKHFSNLIGISVQGVSNAITDLVKKGYISIDNSETKRNFGRIITIHSDVYCSIHSDVESKENKTTTSTKYDEYVSKWNTFAEKVGKSKVAKLSDTRKKKLLQRSKEYQNLEEIFNYVLTKAEKSHFLKKGNFFTFDWLIENDNNLLKVYEGKYDNQEQETVIM